MKRLLLILPLLSGCAFVEYTPTDACNAHGPVRILTSKPSDGTYKVCGSLFVSGSMATDQESANAMLQKEAAKYGANAVLLLGGLKSGYGYQHGYYNTGRALAIQIQ